MQAAILRVKLNYLDKESANRREIANHYLKNIENEKIVLPSFSIPNNHVWHVFAIRTEERDELQEYLSNHGVQTLIHYPIPPHKQRAYKEWNKASFPISEKIHSKILSIPISGIQSFNKTNYIIEQLNLY